MDLSHETIFITGASAGMGAACARRFAMDGARLILLARRADRLRALASELGTPCHVIACDVRDRPAVERELAALPDAFKDISVLVNNAGLALGLNPAQRAELADWDAMVDTNIRAVLHLTHRVLPGMVARNHGHVVNLGSVAASYPYPGGNAYGGTKAFLHQFSQNLRADLVGTRVRVTCIEPGMVETEFSVVRYRGDQDKARAVYAGMKPLGGDDIADVIHFAVTRPAHVNLNIIELMPVAQAFGPFAVSRQG